MPMHEAIWYEIAATDVIGRVVSFLAFRDVVALSATSRAMALACRQEPVWAELLRRDFRLAFSNDTAIIARRGVEGHIAEMCSARLKTPKSSVASSRGGCIRSARWRYWRLAQGRESYRRLRSQKRDIRREMHKLEARCVPSVPACCLSASGCCAEQLFTRGACQL